MQTSLVSTFFVSLLVFSSLVHSQDSCTSNLSLQDIPFSTTSLKCESVWASEDFILRYEQTGSVWNFILSTPDTNSWVSIGFSSNGRMVGTSAIAGWVPSGSSTAGVIKQYYLRGTGSQSCLPDTGSLSVTNMSITSQSSRLFLVFQLQTTQPQSSLIYAVGPRNNLPSSPDYLMAEHRSQTSTSLNFATGQSASTNTGSTLKTTHGALNILSWGILMILGVIMARYFKRYDPTWFYAHLTIQLTGFVLAIAGIITGFFLEDQTSGDVDTHKAIGIFVLVLGCCQVSAFLVRPDKASKIRRYWNWFHHYFGRGAILLGIGNIFYGISISNGGDSWNAGYGIILAILALIVIVLEVRFWVKK
ncbi:PREDICTED: cytochrome b561 and DOMON domain-containing protein At3g07570-like [Nelumbo nucifera]|uniref:Cytochrome b561 and DOMON domain-containing protein At3g07570-like n=2 Tax=Nelumbo nucifera TaxID=4432 RepID=A0A1U7ZVQ9_NELNU|nr:PREDICTED: cytochrome b561 and DOMON domain-containing protein At3g07570-like [Nelumbo nucifera]DAD43460.1 TPA_asm: hypothetical protein HUJ06_001690 [Nelumbo nucifera]